MGLLALIQLCRIIRVVRCNSELWRRVVPTSSQHVVIFLSCTLRAASSIQRSKVMVPLTLMDKAVRILVSALPMLLQFWAFTLLVLQWAAIYHLSLAANPLKKIRPYFFVLNAVYGVVVGGAVVIISLANEIHIGQYVDSQALLMGISLTMGVITFIGSLSFLIYGLLLVRVLHAGDAKRRMTMRFPEKGVVLLSDRRWYDPFCPKFCRNNRRDVRRMLQVATLVSSSLAGEAITWCLAAFDENFEHLMKYTACYLTFDLLAFLALLIIYYAPVTNIVLGRRTNAGSNSSVTTQWVDLSQKSASALPRPSLTPATDCPMVVSPTTVTRTDGKRGSGPPRALSPPRATTRRLQDSSLSPICTATSLSPLRADPSPSPRPEVSPSRRTHSPLPRNDLSPSLPVRAISPVRDESSKDFPPSPVRTAATPVCVDMPSITLPTACCESKGNYDSSSEDECEAIIVGAELNLMRYTPTLLMDFAVSKQLTLVDSAGKSVAQMIEAREFPIDGRVGAMVLEAMKVTVRELDVFAARRAARKNQTKPRLPHRPHSFHGQVMVLPTNTLRVTKDDSMLPRVRPPPRRGLSPVLRAISEGKVEQSVKDNDLERSSNTTPFDYSVSSNTTGSMSSMDVGDLPECIPDIPRNSETLTPPSRSPVRVLPRCPTARPPPPPSRSLRLPEAARHHTEEPSKSYEATFR